MIRGRRSQSAHDAEQNDSHDSTQWKATKTVHGAFPFGPEEVVADPFGAPKDEPRSTATSLFAQTSTQECHSSEILNSDCKAQLADHG